MITNYPPCPTCGEPHDHVHACAECGRAEIDDGRPFECPVHGAAQRRFDGSVARWANNMLAAGHDVTVTEDAPGQVRVSGRPRREEANTTMTMITDRDIRERVEAAIRANGAELAEGIDVDRVTREIVETYGLVDIETIDPQEFWRW